jgi:hypothetical protein
LVESCHQVCCKVSEKKKERKKAKPFFFPPFFLPLILKWNAMKTTARTHIATEILQTEKAYVEFLKTMQETYEVPLKGASWDGVPSIVSVCALF